MRIKYIFLLLPLLISIYSHTSAHENDLEVTLSPFIDSFTKSEYFGENQNWDIAHSKKGNLYFANSIGLVVYNGEQWESFPSPNRMRAVFCQNDTIFVGGDRFLGFYLEKDLRSGFHPITNITNNVWKIFALDHQIIFQSFNKLYAYDKNGNIGYERIKEGNTTYAFGYQNKVYYQVVDGDLYAMVIGQESTKLTDGTLKGITVKFIKKLSEDTYVLGSLKKGLLIYDAKNKTVKAIDNALSALLIAFELNKVVDLNNGQFAFATLKGGLIISDLEGKRRYVCNVSNGLANNRVHALKLIDDQLWVATDNGISVVLAFSKSLFINDMSNKVGSTTDGIIHQGVFYWGTNAGLYWSPVNQKTNIKQIHQVPGMAGHVWRLKVIGGELFCTHEKGLFKIDDRKARKISKVGGGVDLVHSEKFPNILYQSSYYGVAVFEFDSLKKEWEYVQNYTPFKNSTRSLIETDQGDLIVTGFGNEAVCVTFDHEKRKISKSRDLNLLAGIDAESPKKCFVVDQEIYLTSRSKTVKLVDGKILPVSEAFEYSQYFSTIGDSLIFHIQNVKGVDKLKLFDLKNQQEVKLPFYLDYLGDHTVYGFENIHLIRGDEVLVCLDNGLAVLKMGDLLQFRNSTKRAVISKFIAHDFAEKQQMINQTTLPFSYNSVAFEFTNHNFINHSEYQFLLEGFDTSWQQVNKANTYSYFNLPAGTYTFKIKTSENPQISSYQFTVEPPIYFTIYAKLGYFVIFLMLIYLIIRFERMFRKRQKYEALLKMRQNINALRDQKNKELLSLQASQLKDAIKEKNRKLGQVLMQTNKKKELIEEMTATIDTLNNANRPIKKSDLQKLNQIIVKGFDKKYDWEVFLASFNETYSNFFDQLREKHPDLSPTDLRLCAYLRIGLTTKELAPLFNITARSLELKRYRLRKKLGLEKELSLKQYIMTFDAEVI